MPSRVNGYTSSFAESGSGSFVDLLEKTRVIMTQTNTAIRVSIPRILKNTSKLFQLTKRSIPIRRMIPARNISGIAALEEANLLINLAKKDSP